MNVIDEFGRATRRRWLQAAAGSAGAAALGPAAAPLSAAGPAPKLRIKQMQVTPIALPDPPILASSGCHGPYFLRSIIRLTTDEGLVGLGETYGSLSHVRALQGAQQLVVGRSAWAYRRLAREIKSLHPAVFGGLEMACVSRWEHIGPAVRTRPVDVALGDIYWFGGLTGLQALGRTVESLGWSLGYHNMRLVAASASRRLDGYASPRPPRRPVGL